MNDEIAVVTVHAAPLNITPPVNVPVTPDTFPVNKPMTPVTVPVVVKLAALTFADDMMIAVFMVPGTLTFSALVPIIIL